MPGLQNRFQYHRIVNLSIRLLKTPGLKLHWSEDNHLQPSLVGPSLAGPSVGLHLASLAGPFVAERFDLEY